MKPILDNTWIIIPAYNEQAVIVDFLLSIKESYAELNIVVIDDGSEDQTSTVVNAISGVHCLRHAINRGAGAATQTGIEYAVAQGGQYFILMDGDAQHTVNEIERIVAPIISGEFDISIGSRFLSEGSSTNMPLLRNLLLHLAKVFTWLLSGLLLSDAQNGFKAFNLKVAQKIDFYFDRYEFCSEFVDIIKLNKFKHVEVPVTVTYSEHSLSKGQKTTNAVRLVYNLLIYKVVKIIFH